MRRKEELLRQIGKLDARIAHLIEQAHKVEKGTDEAAVKSREGKEVERTDYHRINHSEAIGYWREARENEARRDALLAKLDDLEAGGGGEPITVDIQFDGPPEDTRGYGLPQG